MWSPQTLTASLWKIIQVLEQSQYWLTIWYVKTHLHSKNAKQGPERTLPVLLLHHATECSHHETIDAVHHNIPVCSALKGQIRVKTRTQSYIDSRSDTHPSLCWCLLVGIPPKSLWVLRPVRPLAPSFPLSLHFFPPRHHHQDKDSAIEGQWSWREVGRKPLNEAAPNMHSHTVAGYPEKPIHSI